MSGLIEKIAKEMEKKVDENLAAMEKRITSKIDEVNLKIDKLTEGNAKK